MNVLGTVIGIIALAIAPIAFLLWFFYTRDKLNPEPRGLILKIFLLGMLAAIPVVLIQWLLPLPRFWVAIAIVPIVAEIAKYCMVRWGAYDSAEFDEPVDGIIFAAVVGLGFATLENIVVLLLTYFTVTSVTVPGSGLPFSPLQAVLDLFAVRGLLGALGHALWSSFWGYGLGFTKFPDGHSKGLVGKGLLAAILSYALFNALALSPGLLPRLAMVLLLAISWFAVMRGMGRALEMSPLRE
ncbi:PrsW family intramembrane metalloprotease [Pseudanabaena sp. FACHB-2040]|uniref:PrsW family intramembrane metalloprotease n=1 Tax=Pseudanabaena sp. FACHB-2040 TaxID=2692859 RepID=UPI00168894F3|nr:PrsW family intramembrane metalloprotease [Pseudanabaena sp. FACHB-2040]MBD2258625.1 PrsW family intramembrane metalloprotease [Pseudanabaena sp. FACHB-2040]